MRLELIKGVLMKSISIKKNIAKPLPSKNNSSGSNQWFKKVLKRVESLGKALLFPIASLPIVALFLRIGVWIASYAGVDPSGNAVHDAAYYIGTLLSTPASVVFGNLGTLFGVALAFGLSKDGKGEAALAGFVGILAFNALIQTGDFSITQLIYGTDILTKEFPTIKSASVLNTGVLGGIVIGCWTAFLYNRYSGIILHPFLSFFSGRRFVPMLVFVSTILWAFFFSLFWIWIAKAFYELGNWMSSTATAGGSSSLLIGVVAGLYGLINRALLPFGMHNVLNAILWFQIPFNYNGKTYNGDINAFAAGVPGSGMFQTGFFPAMMFGLPAAAAAMFMSSEKPHRKLAGGILISAAGVSFLTGVTEPIEFAFLYVAPLLYIFHAILTGLTAFIIVALDVHIGFGFSAGLFDYIISIPNSVKLDNGNWYSGPWMLFLIGIPTAAAYYFVFSFAIKKWNLSTIGRNDNIPATQGTITEDVKTKGGAEISKDDQKVAQSLKVIIAGLGGEENIKSFTSCATRLRVDIKDFAKVNQATIKKAPGVFGTSKVGDTIQVIVGPTAWKYEDVMKKMLG